ncbi:hypothetical protein [Oceanibium sediminis]|uniref:hypothetical protein n=1 Tax=Oceanibium sediminis TaxID=2026339 RepID=UPI000DD2F6B3|nr:hypothetical protein [Oceanibium sediminis]
MSTQILDTARRDTLTGTAGSDHFVLRNDGAVDVILGFQDGVDRIDLTHIEASWDQLMIRQLSPTEYVIDYHGEERIRVTFEHPAEVEITQPAWLLDETDFIFAPGLPEATTQVIFETQTSGKEVLYGTSDPDIFVLADDNERDTIRRFEPGKDLVDLAAYGTSFGDLKIIEKKEGRIAIKVPSSQNKDKLVLIDNSFQLTAEDITADMFIF